MRKGLLLFALLTAGICSCSTDETVTVEFRIAEVEPALGLTEMTISGIDEKVYLHDEVLLTNADIDTAFVSMRNERPAVDVFFTDSARGEFAAITRGNMGKRMGIVVDGELVSAPVIRSPILQGRAIIMGDFTTEEAERIAEGIMHK